MYLEVIQPLLFIFLSELGNMVFQSDLLSRSTVILNLTLNCVYFQPLLISFIIDSLPSHVKQQKTILDLTIFIESDKEMTAQQSEENMFFSTGRK